MKKKMAELNEEEALGFSFVYMYIQKSWSNFLFIGLRDLAKMESFHKKGLSKSAVEIPQTEDTSITFF